MLKFHAKVARDPGTPSPGSRRLKLKVLLDPGRPGRDPGAGNVSFQHFNISKYKNEGRVALTPGTLNIIAAMMAWAMCLAGCAALGADNSLHMSWMDILMRTGT